MTFRGRLFWALVVSWARAFGWLLWTTRFLRRLDAFEQPTGTDAPDEAGVRKVLVVSAAALATADACCWTVTRPLLPRQPELARLVYVYVPNLVHWWGARRLAVAMDLPELPWRRALLPRGRRLAGIATSVLMYGAVERALARRR